MSKILFAAFAAFLMFLTGPALAWELDAMNRTIDGTNFLVNDPPNCSGTLVDLENRIVITNWHCIRSGIKRVKEDRTDSNGDIRQVERIEYRPVTITQRSYADFKQVGSLSFVTDIVAQDEALDLAILQVKAQKLPHTFATQLLPMGVDIIRGEVVYAVGNPALLDASVTVGIVSNLARKLNVAGTEREYMQMSAPIFGGNSGGALYNDSGQMIGIPAAAAAGGGSLAFAIRIDTIRTFLDAACFSTVYDPVGGAERDMACIAEREGTEAVE